MKFQHLAHIAFRVKDMDRALDFYCGTLGLRKVYSMTHGERLEKTGHEIPQGANYDDEWIVFLEFGDRQFIELFSALPQAEMTDYNDKHIGYLHFCLEVEDIHAAYEELTAKGANIFRPLDLGPDHTWQFWVCDPDGNRFEICQYTDASKELL